MKSAQVIITVITMMSLTLCSVNKDVSNNTSDTLITLLLVENSKSTDETNYGIFLRTDTVDRHSYNDSVSKFY